MSKLYDQIMEQGFEYVKGADKTLSLEIEKSYFKYQIQYYIDRKLWDPQPIFKDNKWYIASSDFKQTCVFINKDPNKTDYYYEFEYNIKTKRLKDFDYDTLLNMLLVDMRRYHNELSINRHVWDNIIISAKNKLSHDELIALDREWILLKSYVKSNSSIFRYIKYRDFLKAPSRIQATDNYNIECEIELDPVTLEPRYDIKYFHYELYDKINDEK